MRTTSSPFRYLISMNIALVIDEFDPLRGGAEFWTYQHALQLVHRGHEVHVVTRKVGETARRSPFIYHLFPPEGSRLKRAAAAERVLRALSMDVIHDIGLGWYSDVVQSEDGSRVAQWESKLLTLPNWARPWKRAAICLLPRYAEFRTLMQRQMEEPTRIVLAVSKRCARDFQLIHGVPEQRIRLVYHGIDLERFSPARCDSQREPLRQQLGFASDDVVFLFVGHDHARKGLTTAIRAVTSLAKEGATAKLLVVGERRSQSARILSRAKLNAFAASAIRFVGRVPDPVPYYRAADAFLLPTFYDPCSLSVGEAAACGLPVITTQQNGASELLTHGRDGFVFDDPADDKVLAAYLQQLLTASTRLRMGQAARRLALAYPLERNTNEMLDVYREIVERGALRYRQQAA